jgi:signal peptidase I
MSRIMNFFERRRWKKTLKQMLHETAHVYHMRGDLMSEQEIGQLFDARAALQSAWDQRDLQALENAADRLGNVLERLRPPRSWQWLRENVEVFAVALSVAMAFRTYFIQPFKIPTASMQPTLYGITVEESAGRGLMDTFPLNIVRIALFGERYVEVLSRAAGEVRILEDRENDRYVLYVGGYPHYIQRGLHLYVQPGERVAEKQKLAAGMLRIGDHIFVDKVRYNFARPKRGDIIVFSTDGINFPDIKQNTFYIKRLAALPGDIVSLKPPYLIVNGSPLLDPYPFRRIIEDVLHGYHGYTAVNQYYGPRSWLWQTGVEKRLENDEYLPLGDNSRHSLDGRYFGPIKERHLVGPAFMVYWPISKRFGLVQ